MVVLLDRKRLEASLIEMPRTLRSIVGVPAHRVRVGQPTKEIGQLPVRHRADDKVPMIGHHTVRKNRQRMASEGFLQNPFEGFVVLRLLQQR